MCTVKETDTHKLWKNIEPHLKKAMQTVYLREVSRCVSSHITPPHPLCVCVCVFIVLTASLLSSVCSGSRCSRRRRSVER